MEPGFDCACLLVLLRRALTRAGCGSSRPPPPRPCCGGVADFCCSCCAAAWAVSLPPPLDALRGVRWLLSAVPPALGTRRRGEGGARLKLL